MTKYKFLILSIIPLLLVGGCSTKTELKKPIHQYLSQGYGINDFNILYADNNWLEGVDHQTEIELKKPYHTYIYLKVDRDNLEIDQNDSDDVFFRVMTGAYIEQHPDVVQFLRDVVKKYGLVQYPEKFKQLETNIFPYDTVQFNIESEQQKNLEKVFKKTQKIDTISLLPKLNPNNPPARIATHLGVVNFNFTFNRNKNKGPIPKAEDIVADFQSHAVLTQGIYNVWVCVEDSHYFGRDHDTIVLFNVDENGKYTILSKPNPDDL